MRGPRLFLEPIQDFFFHFDQPSHSKGVFQAFMRDWLGLAQADIFKTSEMAQTTTFRRSTPVKMSQKKCRFCVDKHVALPIIDIRELSRTKKGAK